MVAVVVSMTSVALLAQPSVALTGLPDISPAPSITAPHAFVMEPKLAMLPAFVIVRELAIDPVMLLTMFPEFKIMSELAIEPRLLTEPKFEMVPEVLIVPKLMTVPFGLLMKTLSLVRVPLFVKVALTLFPKLP